MLIRFDQFRDLDRLAQQVWGGVTQPAAMPMDAYRQGEAFVVHFDLPGVSPESVELTVDKNVLTVSARRDWQPSEDTEVLVRERPRGTFSRQLLLGESLDTEHIQASYTNGVLTVTIPVAEQAKPRRVQISSGSRPEAVPASAAA